MKEVLVNLFPKVKDKFSSDELFYDTQVKANKLGALIMLVTGLLLVVVYVLTWLGLFLLSIESVRVPCIAGITAAIAVTIIGKIKHYDAWWLKYLMLTGIVGIYAGLDVMLTHKTAILMVIPVVFSSRYFSKDLTIFILPLFCYMDRYRFKLVCDVQEAQRGNEASLHLYVMVNSPQLTCKGEINIEGGADCNSGRDG